MRVLAQYKTGQITASKPKNWQKLEA